MLSDFDLALGLFRPTPQWEILEEGLSRLTEHLQSIRVFDGDIKTFWSPNPNSDFNDSRFDDDWLPIRSIAPLWLSRMARPATADRAIEGLLYQIYCRSLDHSTRIKTVDFFYRSATSPAALELCIELLTLRHFPKNFFPEILGVTLAHESMELPGRKPEMAQHQRALAALKMAADAKMEPHRIRKGYALFRSGALNVFSAQGNLAPTLTHREAFARIVSEKASAAKGYHARILLEDRSLDAWFEEHATNPEPILRALEGSSRVSKACPFGSRLIKAMDFGGPMFGVFDEVERKLAAEWIASPESAASPRTAVRLPHFRKTWQETKTSPMALKIRGSRDLFHHLVAAENSTQLQGHGLRLIQGILRRTRRLQSIGVLSRAFGYQPACLDQFLHERHAAALKTPPRRLFTSKLSRDAWRWTLIQLSPAVLVDGAWLAGVASTSVPPQPWHLELIKIHEDELGNGDLTQNHPLIYRRLLEALDIHLPDIADPAFVGDARIHPFAFHFPSYMVAMGWHYTQFEPECLGLNLAIELSGLGSGYQRVIESLRQAGIDPLIAELHLSIDNLASGHARRARDAIVLYLENIMRTEGPNAQKRAWERIYQGFLSYSVGLGSIGVVILARYLISGSIKIHN